MTAQEELQAIIADAKAWKWTPELFDRIRRYGPYGQQRGFEKATTKT